MLPTPQYQQLLNTFRASQMPQLEEAKKRLGASYASKGTFTSPVTNIGYGRLESDFLANLMGKEAELGARGTDIAEGREFTREGWGEQRAQDWRKQQWAERNAREQWEKMIELAKESKPGFDWSSLISSGMQLLPQTKFLSGIFK